MLPILFLIPAMFSVACTVVAKLLLSELFAYLSLGFTGITAIVMAYEIYRMFVMEARVTRIKR